MIIDERTYTCYPGKVKAFLDVYERLGKPIQWPIIGEPIGFFTLRRAHSARSCICGDMKAWPIVSNAGSNFPRRQAGPHIWMLPCRCSPPLRTAS